MSRIEKIKLYTPLPQYRRKQFNWRFLIAILITILATGTIVRLADAIHYNGSINQISQQNNLIETKEGQDIHKLMNADVNTLQCSQFLSNFAQQECQLHNKQLKQ
ncbi:MAG: hypothetical protein ABSB12_02015 [Candidatus Saccharimonadales bacterium]|jgi:hypothetical protein